MKPSLDSLNSNQPKTLSTRVDKKRVNIPWNHRLFFQIGLIISLFTALVVMESVVGYVPPETSSGPNGLSPDPYVMDDFTVEQPQKPVTAMRKDVVKKVILAKPIIDVLTPIDDISPLTETPTAPTTDAPSSLEPPVVTPSKPVKPSGPTSMKSVEFVPVFPGCESLTSNEEKIDCMSSKISDFIQKKFRTDEFDNLEADVLHRIYVQFKIDKNGYIVDIEARAPNAELEDEGMRVISKLPRMKPGRQGESPVDVMYMVPIVFKVD
jgi:protein TonB